MIYLDNAATTREKPEIVKQSFMNYINDIGASPGRGSYSLGITASRMLFESRKTIGDYFGLERRSNVIFTKNSTEAINLFFNGFLNNGDHVVITCYEHNAVLRPLHSLKDKGVIDYSIISRADLELPVDKIWSKYFRPNTKVFATTLASNLTGRIVFRKDLLEFCKNKGVNTFVDSSQGAGKLDISMNKMHIDYLAFTSHKDLLGLPGSGGLCCTEYESLRPLIQGGTGVHGEDYKNPKIFPEGYEAGTLNMPSIWALKNAIDYINENKNYIRRKEKELTEYLMDQLLQLNNIVIYDVSYERVGTIAFNVYGYSSNEVVRKLDSGGICVRGGIHCAILAHESLQTVKIGAVRASINYSNSYDDIDQFIECLRGL